MLINDLGAKIINSSVNLFPTTKTALITYLNTYYNEKTLYINRIRVCLLSLAQTPEDKVLKFLGIPVDGTKEHMIAELKKKDFKYNATRDCLTGKFNGKDSDIFVSTNYGKVDRIIVADTYPTNETDIRIKFNNLISQMDKNKKYISLLNDIIPEDEDISYEMTVKNKRYEAVYHFAPGLTEDDIKVKSLAKLALEGKSETYTSEDSALAILSVLEEYTTGVVWFCITESYGKYVIAMYYENNANRPNGDDL